MARSRKAFWTNRRVIVTGGAGFIGYALATKLAEDGVRVYVLDIKPGLPKFSLGNKNVRNKITYIRGSVTSKKTLNGILKNRKIQTVFHLAAEAIVGRALKNPARALEANIKGTWVLLECCRRATSIREIIVASSDKAYGSHAKLPYTEDAALQGMNPYDCSKSCADLVAQMFAMTFGMPIAIARCGNVYGPGDTNWSRLIPDAFRCAARGRVLDIRSDGTFKRDYIYIDDVVNAYMTLAEHMVRGSLSGKAFNFGNNKPLRVTDVLKEIIRVTPTLRYRILNIARNEIHDQYLDARKAGRILKWKSTMTVRDGMQRTAAWYSDFLRNSISRHTSSL